MRMHRAAVFGVVTLLGLTSANALEPGLPSKTAVYIAAARAIGNKNPDPAQKNPDHVAILFLGPRERALLPDYPMDALDLDYADAMRRIPNPGNVTTQTIRTKFFDKAMIDAYKEGVRHVVVLGAGFDSRAYRIDLGIARGVTFFEVDSPPTQEYKKQRVKDIFRELPGFVRYVPMDFTKDSLLAQLERAGYDAQARTFFLWEGVTEYLPEAAVKARYTLCGTTPHRAARSRSITSSRRIPT